MPKTERLYYIDSYLQKIESQVTGHSDDGRTVTLDRTIFYPASGGQPQDSGTLNGIPVLDVIDEDGTIRHVLAERLDADQVVAEIAWARRYDHMQQHTGQHLLSAVWAELFDVPTLSFRMGEQVSTIELGIKELRPEQVEAVTLKATEWARRNLTIAIREEAASLAQGLRKPSGRTGPLRIVEIPGVDRSACGGTHVASLAEVLPLEIREQEKVRGNLRLSFVCGNRAMKRMQLDFDNLSRSALALNTSTDHLEEAVLQLKQAFTESQKQKLKLESEMARENGLALYRETTADAAGVRKRRREVLVIDENARQQAVAFASQSKSVLLMHSAEGLLVACSPDAGVNAGAILKLLLQKHGARGGGSATLAQGSFTDPSVLTELAAELGFQSC